LDRAVGAAITAPEVSHGADPVIVPRPARFASMGKRRHDALYLNDVRAGAAGQTENTMDQGKRPHQSTPE